jgi:hypothetical protein
MNHACSFVAFIFFEHVNSCFCLSNIVLHINFEFYCDLYVLGMEMKQWYVVYEGRIPGVYDEWADCLKQVNKFNDNNYKG